MKKKHVNLILHNNMLIVPQCSKFHIHNSYDYFNIVVN